jgi:hypothetical protein
VGWGWPSLATQAIKRRGLPAGSIREYRELEAGRGADSNFEPQGFPKRVARRQGAGIGLASLREGVSDAS